MCAIPVIDDKLGVLSDDNYKNVGNEPIRGENKEEERLQWRDITEKDRGECKGRSELPTHN